MSAVRSTTTALRWMAPPVIWSMFCVIMLMSRLTLASVNTESVRSLLVHSLV